MKKNESAGIMSKRLQLPPAGQSCPIFEGQTSEAQLSTWNLTTGAHMIKEGEWMLTDSGSQAIRAM